MEVSREFQSSLDIEMHEPTILDTSLFLLVGKYKKGVLPTGPTEKSNVGASNDKIYAVERELAHPKSTLLFSGC